MKQIQKPNPPTGLRRTLWRLPILGYRVGLGPLFGGRFMLLTHTGRVSGLPRQACIEIIESQPGRYIAASGFGAAADWFKNIRKNPEVDIQVGRRVFRASATVLSADEGGALMERYAPRHPKAARQLCRLMGFEVDGSAQDYREVGRALPFVAFDEIR